ncbi:hypothetical protein BpHYR1_010005 [Brachionus plicatilis]|uniref:Uncharacterized protein n=1 Tax=Brachionus plicatilis TaxID=10195 RepID=A0A3M7PSV6_BRAPC|nr:hypothetical protein BpHYR1_010005 [Brachionus plicatilis]
MIYIWIETIKQAFTKLTGPAPSAPKSTAKSASRFSHTVPTVPGEPYQPYQVIQANRTRPRSAPYLANRTRESEPNLIFKINI